MTPSPTSATAVPYKLFGLQRTGTNLTTALIARNFSAHPLPESGWKHGKAKELASLWGPANPRYVLCVKNPYAWLVSCFDYFQRSNGGDRSIAPQFLRDPGMSFEEFCTSANYDFGSPVERWNGMYRHWVETLPGNQTVVVRQEDQVLAQANVVEAIASRLRLAPSAQRHTFAARVDVDGSIRGPFDRDQYLLRLYMARYSPMLLAWVNSNIDAGLLRSFDYIPEKWALSARRLGKYQMLVRANTSDGADAGDIFSDPYGFEEVKRRDGNVTRIVDVGGHIGAATLLAKQFWPNAAVTAYEPCAENERLLKINTSATPGTEIIPAALIAGNAAHAWFSQATPTGSATAATGIGVVHPSASSGTCRVAAVNLQQAVQQCGGRLDLLKVGCSFTIASLLGDPVARRVIGEIRWVCGRLPVSASECAAVQEAISRTHHVQIRSTSCGPCFLAERQGLGGST